MIDKTTTPTGAQLAASGELSKFMCDVLRDCKCRMAWRSLGTLYGIGMGYGWVRLDTHPNCPEHKPGGRHDIAYEAARVANGWPARRRARTDREG
jgi:hypothetical protein